VTPIYIGNNRAFCRLQSGEYVCVDTDSIDSIDYLLDFGLEGDVIPVFQRFLTPSSVVLDIGANVGLYTVTSGSLVGRRGRLYAFEANPHTFQLLRRSAYANKLFHNPNITLVNALVGDCAGRGRLYYHPHELGGATMRDVTQLGMDWRSVEVEMITIDGFLPDELAVDLAKIDVEGYEPFVLKGMEQTIARSPNIRIIVELFDALVDPVFGTSNFIDYIHDLGFHICRIEAGGRLNIIETVRQLAAENYLLLTRTPEADRARDYRVIPITGFTLQQGLAVRDGELVWREERQPLPAGASLIWGPYLSLPPARYTFTFIGSLEGRLGVRLTSGSGKTLLKEAILDTLDTPLTLHLPELAEEFEIVAFHTEGLRALRLSEVRMIASP